MRRLGRILLRLLRLPVLFFRYSCQFGPRAAWWMCIKYLSPGHRGQRYMDFLAGFFDRELKGLVKEYSRDALEPVPPAGFAKTPVWVCWLTGLDDRPPLVEMCCKSIEAALPDTAQVRYITLENYRDYVEIPEFIREKFRAGKICPAHFSDVIRFSLLSRYGGMWLDATVYVSGRIPEAYISAPYYTQKAADKDRYFYEPSRAQWCGFIWAGKPGNRLFRFVRDGLIRYWEKYDMAIDYIFFDYIILTACRRLPDVRQMMDAQEPNNQEIWALWESLEKPYSAELYWKVTGENIFHKLSHQRPLRERTEGGELTLYGYLRENTGRDAG